MEWNICQDILIFWILVFTYKCEPNFSMTCISVMFKVNKKLLDESHIIGNSGTKHGEIAEVIEVNIRNAKQMLNGQTPTAWDVDSRIDYVDYMVGDHQVQAKFCQTVGRTLGAVLTHMDANDFGKSGSYYHIPKEQHDLLMRMLVNKDTASFFDSRSLNSVKEKIAYIQSETGRPFHEVIRPSISTYDEVQPSVRFNTLEGHEEHILVQNEEIETGIRQKANLERERVAASHTPSWGEAAKVGVIGAGIGGTFAAGLSIYRKQKEGKSLFDYDIDDWNEVGIDFAKGSVSGGVSGMAIYGITNYLNVGAPLASAFVTASFGVGRLVASYTRGEISGGDFIDQGSVICFEAAAVALGATIGQTVIPIPIIGTLLGTFAAKTLLEIAGDYLDERSLPIQQQMKAQYDKAMAGIDRAYQMVVEEIVEAYENLGQMTGMAFDFDKNARFRFNSSIKLSQTYQVAKGKILHTTEEVDAFFMIN